MKRNKKKKHNIFISDTNVLSDTYWQFQAMVVENQNKLPGLFT